MNALTYSLLSLYAQASTPTAPEAEVAPAPVPAQAPEDLEAARAAAAETAKTAAGQSSESLNIGELFAHMNVVEQVVVVILLLLAVYTLAIMAEKIFITRSASSKMKDFVSAFRKANSVEEAEAIVRKQPASGMKSMFDAGMAEVRRTQDLGLYTMRDARDHTMQRVQSAMQVKQNGFLEEMSSSMTLIASIGSNAPFIGLFGTVWGIMNSFIGIVATQSTSLVAVAPGIAGALLATATGLVAAVPAVLVYNFTSKQIAKIGGKCDDFVAEFVSLVSRDMDRRGA
jgi:biopolymer transport protein ExbB/TolQ